MYNWEIFQKSLIFITSVIFGKNIPFAQSADTNQFCVLHTYFLKHGDS
jgi:hypothetical protein